MEHYPEQRPEVSPVNRFTFDLRTSVETEKDLDLHINALEERINNIVRRVEIGNIPVLQHLLGLTRDRKELETLGKALIRVSKLAPELDDLKRRKSLIELARKDPHWFAATFADLSAEVNEMTAQNPDDNNEAD